jgi:hypothetical protein
MPGQCVETAHKHFLLNPLSVFDAIIHLNIRRQIIAEVDAASLNILQDQMERTNEKRRERKEGKKDVNKINKKVLQTMFSKL